MKLRDWVKERFGGTGKTLLDESVYSNKDLRKDISKLEHSLKKKEREMDKHRRKYKQLLQEGARASSMKRKKYAQKAKFEKKKYQIKKKQYRASSIKLGTLISIDGMREIMDMHEQEDLEFDRVLDEDPDAQEIQARIMDQMAEFGLEMEDIQEIQEALDIPIMEDQLEMEAGEEMQTMEQIAASEISAEQVDIDSDLETETDDIDVGMDELEEEEELGGI